MRNQSYPVRLEKKLLDAVKPIAKRESRSLKSQIEVMLRAALAAAGLGVKP